MLNNFQRGLRNKDIFLGRRGSKKNFREVEISHGFFKGVFFFNSEKVKDFFRGIEIFSSGFETFRVFETFSKG